ncbi:MAG: hypothetical protein ACR2PH_13385, partial [Desulfobulbia bacterium]
MERKWQGFETYYFLIFPPFSIVRIADITGRGLVLRSSSTLLTSAKTYTGKRQRGRGEYLRLFFVCIMIT